MASESTDPPPTGQQSSQNQSSESDSSEGDENSGETQSDPSTSEMLENTVDGSDQLTDPATKEHLGGAT
jgi:hypothetical protein